MIPQPTEQYGQVFRVSVVRASLNVRTSARTRSGVKPRAVRLVAPMPPADSLKNWRRVKDMPTSTGVGDEAIPDGAPRGGEPARSYGYAVRERTASRGLLVGEETSQPARPPWGRTDERSLHARLLRYCGFPADGSGTTAGPSSSLSWSGGGRFGSGGRVESFAARCSSRC